jgi:hybrid cluster-associated redox disulfide protein
MKHLAFSPQTRVADVLAQAPHTLPVFLELKLGCIGCSINRFCTLAELAAHYELALDQVFDKFNERLVNHESD